MSEQTPKQRRKDIQQTIEALITEYVHTWEEHGYDETIIASWYMVCETVAPNNARDIVELSDDRSSRFTKMGLLFTALNDPRWFPKASEE